VYDNEVDRAAMIVSVIEGLLRPARDPAGMAPGGPKHTYVHAPVVISHTLTDQSASTLMRKLSAMRFACPWRRDNGLTRLGAVSPLDGPLLRDSAQFRLSARHDFNI